MSDENVIKFPPPSSVEDCPAVGIAVNLPDIRFAGEAPPCGPEIGCLGFDDLEAAFNMRGWLQKALEAAGGKMTAGGFGFGMANLWVELEGHTYEVTIKPVKL